MRKLNVFLADLIHNQHYTYYTVPLNIAAIATRLEQRLGSAVDVTLFKFPDRLMNSLGQKPDIVAFSNYDWNYQLSRKMAQLVHEANPQALTVMGGPNVRRDGQGVTSFLQEAREIDAYVMHEGEDAFTDLVERVLEHWPCDPRRLLQRDHPVIPQTAYLLDGSDEAVIGGLCESANVKPIPYPSAWLSGRLDEFMDQDDYPLVPSIETNRGCPYACHFCVWGAYEKNKVRKYNLDVVMEELGYIFRRAKKNSYLFICDANFGLIDRDIEIAEEIRRLADKYGTISKIELFSDKTRIERNKEVFRILGDLTLPCFATQTFNKEAAKNAGRKNISEERMTQFVNDLKHDSLNVYTDLLTGIPGETIESHTNNLKQVYDIGFQKPKVHDIRLLRGSRMEEDDYIESHGVKSEFRVIPAAFGDYGGHKVLEYERCIRATNTMSEENFRQLRLFHGLVYLLINVGFGEPLLNFCAKRYCHPLDLINRMSALDGIENYPVLNRKIEKYKKQAANEWFESIEQADAYYKQNKVFEQITTEGFPRLNTEFAADVIMDIHLKEELIAYLASVIGQGVPEDDAPLVEQLRVFSVRRIRSPTADQDPREITLSREALLQLGELVSDLAPDATMSEHTVQFRDEHYQTYRDKLRHYGGDNDFSNAVQALLHEDSGLLVRSAHFA